MSIGCPLIMLKTQMQHITGNPGDVILNRTRMRPFWIHVDYTTSGTAGNRNLIFTLKDTTGTKVLDVRAGANQGANLTRHYVFGVGFPRETSFTNGSELFMPLPPFVVEANYQLVIDDENSVDAADTFDMHIQSEI